MESKYNVVQFFENETHEYVRRNVSALEATRAIRHYTDNVATRMGIVSRVIITDELDCTCFEWTYGKGITYPTQQMVDEVLAEATDSSIKETNDENPTKD